MSEKTPKETKTTKKELLNEITNLNLRMSLIRFCRKVVEENLDPQHMTIPQVIIYGNMSQYYARVIRTFIKMYNIDLNTCKELIS